MKPNSSLLISLLFMQLISVGQNIFVPDEKYLAHSSRAYGYYEAKEYVKASLSYDSLLKTASKGQMVDRYNAACSWALVGNKDKAFYYLNQVATIDKFVHLSHLLSDSDLTSLHADKRWQPIVELVKSNKEKAEATLNKPLAALLDSIYHEDQHDRKNIDTVEKQFGWGSRQMDSLFTRMRSHDSTNLLLVRKIIDTHGWLGPDEVGEQGASTIFLVIQHADSLTQVTYLPKMRDAVKRGKARPQDLALLEDRVLTSQGKEQIYGSQLRRNEEGKYEFFPITDEPNVNKRRASVGLGPLEAYAKHFGIEYVLPKSEALKKSLDFTRSGQFLYNRMKALISYELRVQ